MYLTKNLCKIFVLIIIQKKNCAKLLISNNQFVELHFAKYILGIFIVMKI